MHITGDETVDPKIVDAMVLTVVAVSAVAVVGGLLLLRACLR